MTSTDQVTNIVQLLTGAVALISILVTLLTAGLEHLRWRRSYLLEERRWAEEINNKVELELFTVRLHEYPKIIRLVKPLSNIEIKDLSLEQAQAIGQALHEQLYEPVVVSMRGDTRKALSNLRDACLLYAKEQIPMGEISTARTYFLSTLFRDLGLKGEWNPEIPSLIETMSKNLALASTAARGKEKALKDKTHS